MTNINSSIIEIPHLGLNDCVLIHNVPKDPAFTWFFDNVLGNGIEGGNTTRLSYNPVNNRWEVATTGEEIACAAAAAGAGSTVGSIYLYPFAFINLQQRELDILNSTTPGDFMINEQSRVHLIGNRKPNDTWTGTNQTLYYDHTKNHITKSSGTNFNYVGQCAYAHPTSGSTVYYPVMFAYEEQYHSQGFKIPKLVPHRPNASCGINQKLCADISGNNFVWSSTMEHGTFNDLWAAETPNLSASEMYAMDYSTAAGKMILPYLDMIYSALNTTRCMLIPKFGPSNTNQSLLNGSFGELFSTPGGYGSVWTSNTFSRDYNYWYKIRPYRTLSCITKTVKDTNNASYAHGNLVLRSQKVNFAMEIPTDLTWTRETFDDLPWNPPGPKDLSNRYLLLAGDYGSNILAPNYRWEIWHKTGYGETMHPTKADAMTPVKLQNTVTSGVLMQEHYPKIVAHDGNTDYVNYDGLNGLWYWNTSEAWNATIVSWEGGTGGVGTMKIEYSIWRYKPDGTQQLLKDWAFIPRTSWFSHEGTDYLKFSFSHTLAEFGLPRRTRQGEITVKYRQYYAGVSPYLSYEATWGYVPSLNLNPGGGLSVYNVPRYELPNPLDIKPLRLKNQRSGDSITGLHNIGKTPAMKRFTTTWSGDVTVEVADFGSIKKFRLVSSLDPSITDDNLRYIYMQKMLYRVQRKSDGRYLDQYINATSSYNAAKGTIWSRKAIKKEISSLYYDATDITYGTGIKINFPISFKSQWMIVDKTPNVETENYEIFVEMVGKAEFMSELNQKVIYKTKVLTFTL